MQRHWMRTIARLAVAVLPLVAWGCEDAPSVTGPSDNGITVRGRVMDYRTQAPVAGAVVQFSSGSAPVESYDARTNTSGSYQLSLPYVGAYKVLVNGASAGDALVKGPSYRGDLFIDSSTCAARYGTVTNARTGRPVSGVTVREGTLGATSASDGWYLKDFRCLALSEKGLGTTFLLVEHPNYVSRTFVLGRGVFFVWRLDFELEPR